MCHVLIIEDEPLVAMSLEDLLAAAGATSFDVASTEHGAVAAAKANPPAVITSDVRLIEGTGPRAVQTIHALIGDIPVIFITGTPAECDPCGPPGIVLGKPLDEVAITDAFRRACSLQ